MNTIHPRQLPLAHVDIKPQGLSDGGVPPVSPSLEPSMRVPPGKGEGVIALVLLRLLDLAVAEDTEMDFLEFYNAWKPVLETMVRRGL